MSAKDKGVQITLRLPADLHDQLKGSRDARSLNAEIVGRLRGTYSLMPGDTDISKKLDLILAHLGAA